MWAMTGMFINVTVPGTGRNMMGRTGGWNPNRGPGIVPPPGNQQALSNRGLQVNGGRKLEQAVNLPFPIDRHPQAPLRTGRNRQTGAG